MCKVVGTWTKIIGGHIFGNPGPSRDILALDRPRGFLQRNFFTKEVTKR
jgi:hypothetical protein